MSKMKSSFQKEQMRKKKKTMILTRVTNSKTKEDIGNKGEQGIKWLT